jgi:hypothetical protein
MKERVSFGSPGTEAVVDRSGVGTIVTPYRGEAVAVSTPTTPAATNEFADDESMDAVEEDTFLTDMREEILLKNLLL